MEINVFFPNHPLRNLIAVGRNKGLSIILATQNMDSFKSKYFDFYANAQYPLIMKQQTIADSVVKDLFGVSGRESGNKTSHCRVAEGGADYQGQYLGGTGTVEQGV